MFLSEDEIVEVIAGVDVVFLVFSGVCFELYVVMVMGERWWENCVFLKCVDV